MLYTRVFDYLPTKYIPAETLKLREIHEEKKGRNERKKHIEVLMYNCATYSYDYHIAPVGISAEERK